MRESILEGGTMGSFSIERILAIGLLLLMIVPNVSAVGLHRSLGSRDLANTPMPMYMHDLQHTGRSPYDTSQNTGHQKWNFTAGSYVRTQPVIGSDGTLYVGSDDHKLYALKPDGTQKWNFTTGHYIYGTPALGSDGTIYFGSWDYKFYAVNPDGTQKWNFTTMGPVETSPAIGADGTLYFGSADNHLYALNPDGSKKWNYTSVGQILSSPAIGTDGTIYFGTLNNNHDNCLYALYPNSTKKWNLTIGDSMWEGPTLAPDGTIYIGSVDYKLYAIWPNGTKRWDFKTKGCVNTAAALGADGTIYVGALGTDLYAIAPNGQKKWNVTLRSTSSSPTIAADGTIFIGSEDHSMYAFYPNGTKRWSFPTGAYLDSTPSIGPDGTVYFGSQDSKIYAVYSKASTLGAPLDLVATGYDSKVGLTWSAPSDDGGSAITNYSIYRGTASGSEAFLAKVGNVHTYIDTAVTNGQTYYYKVTATNSAGEGPRSNEATATPATRPGAPTGLKAVPGNAQVSLNWTAPSKDGGSPVTNYIIYRDGVRLIELGNVLAYVDGGLVNGQTYSYNGSAVNRVGEGNKSIGALATPRAVPGESVLTATGGNTAITLTWTLPATDGGSPITNYTIYRGTVSGGEVLLVKGYTGGTFWVDTNITTGVRYFYKVSAYNSVGEGPRSNEANASVGELPGRPLGPYTIAGNTVVILKWSAPRSGGRPDHYNIYRSGSKDGNYTLVGTSIKTRYTDTQLKNGQKYWYKINGQNQQGVSEDTSPVSGTPYGTYLIGVLVVVIILILILVAVSSVVARVVQNRRRRSEGIEK